MQEPLRPVQVSWLTALFRNNKAYTPDDSCSPADVYFMSLHFAAMTITSSGYGDIVPTRMEEYIVCVLCSFIGGLIWAYVVGCTCSILSIGDPIQEEFEASSMLHDKVMEETAVPVEMRHVFGEYLVHARDCKAMRLFQDLAQGGPGYRRRTSGFLLPPSWIAVDPLTGRGAALRTRSRAARGVNGDSARGLVGGWSRCAH